MNLASISQALQALLPAVQAPQVSGERGDAATAPQAGGDGRLLPDGMAGTVAMPAGETGSLLAALETNPLQSQLPPSLSDTLTRVATALDLAPADAPAPVALQAVAPEPAEASRTLQQMAQVTAHVDIAADRHGSTTESLAAPESGTPAAGPSSHAEPLAMPMARDVQLTPAVASLLHVPAARLSAKAPAHEAERDRGERGASHQDDAQEVPEEEDRDAAAAPTPAPPAPPAPASTVARDGDLQLYQQLMCALHERRGEGDAVERALEELSRQRRVVLATPAGPVAGWRCPAHVDVLWPRRGGGRVVRLTGELLWSQRTADVPWLEAHLVKSQGPGSVRELVPVAGQEDARHIAVCLGAQAVPMTAWSQACLRVRDGNRLWKALEPQWSLRVVIGRHPLALRAVSSVDGGGMHVG